MVVLSHDRLNRGRSLSPSDKAEAGIAAVGGQNNEDDRGFLELQACIPHLAENKRVSRLDILLEAINYIDHIPRLEQSSGNVTVRIDENQY